MNQAFNALGRPSEFEAQAEAIWADYEKFKVAWDPLPGSTNTLKWIKSTSMRETGQKAAKLMEDLKRAYPARMAAQNPAVPPDAPSWLPSIPWYVWGIGIAAVGVLFVLPAMEVKGVKFASRWAMGRQR